MVPSDQSQFIERMKLRSADDYAQFFLRRLENESVILDCGCGAGTITVGLAAHSSSPKAVIGLDRDALAFRPALDYARHHGLSHLRFLAGDVLCLPFRDCSFDAVLAHSVLETITDPLRALREVYRVLRPGALLGAASVEYGGLLLSADPTGLLQRFYETRERLWLAAGIASPRCGRQLRALLTASGFTRVEASARYVSYGTPDAVRQFGRERADECRSDELTNSVLKYGLADAATLRKMADAWIAWGADPNAFLAFAWCDAIGWRRTRRGRKASRSGHIHLAVRETQGRA